MRRTIVILVIFISLCNRAEAQDSTRVQRYEYVIGSSLVFSLADYVGYNLISSIKPGTAYNHALLALHTFDAALPIGINHFLYKTLGLSSAISYDLIWWTWGDDMGFYGWTYALNPASPWINRTNNGLRLSSINWAGWTPVGLVRPKGSWIVRSTLLAQAVIGFSISMAIL